jgi:hypothetical protein
MVWVGILWGECRNIIRMTPFKDVVFYSFEEVGYELGNLDELAVLTFAPLSPCSIKLIFTVVVE